MRTLLVAVALAALLAPPPAVALDFRPCAGTADYECARLPVPLDPAAPGGETLTLEVRRLVETREGRSVLVALAGGPGQASTVFVDDFAEQLAEGLADTQLVVVDLRGTGASGALSCRALASAPAVLSAAALARVVGACGDQLGPRRRFFTTTEAVADLEALRGALGAPRVSLYGASYGAYVAQRYALAHPDRTERVVLDSPPAQDQGGPFDLDSYAAVRRVVRTLCAGGRCAGVRDPVGDLRRLARRFPLRGRVVDARGRARRARVGSPADLFDVLVSSDFSDALRGALPAAVHAAARGDTAPLLRLLAGEADAGDDDVEPPEEFSDALFFATTCEEKPVPWGSPAAPLAGRPAARAAALRSAGDRAFAPFGRGAANATQVGTAFCALWPPTSAAAPPAPAQIPARALVLSGATDLRTPAEEGARTAAGFRDGVQVVVPGAGHAILSRRIGCVTDALRRFFADAAVGDPCGERPAAPGPRPAPVAPRRLGRRVAPMALATFADALRLAAIEGELGGRVRAGGLRGGRTCVAPARGGLVVALRRAGYVRGLAVTGRAVVRGGRIRTLRATLRAGHRRGSLRVAHGRAAGRLGHRRLRARVSGARIPAPAIAPGARRGGC